MKHNKGQKGTETYDDVLARIQRDHANNYLRYKKAETQNRKRALRYTVLSTIVVTLLAAAAILAVEAYYLETKLDLDKTYDVRLAACERQHSEAYCAKKVK